MSFVNIVILAKDRFRLTEQCLATLRAATPRERYRLLVVDDGSADFRVRKLLADLGPDTMVRVENSGHRVGKLKSLGVRAAETLHGRGEWLYLGDADTAFLPSWLSVLTESAEASEMGRTEFKLWGGQIHPFHHPIAPQMTWYTPDGKTWVMDEHEVLDGPSWLMRWATWDEVGPLTGEAPGPCQSEDAEWCARLRKRGGRIGVVVPHVVVHTGLSQVDGQDAPGRAEREAGRVEGILYE